MVESTVIEKPWAIFLSDKWGTVQVVGPLTREEADKGAKERNEELRGKENRQGKHYFVKFYIGKPIYLGELN